MEGGEGDFHRVLEYILGAKGVITDVHRAAPTALEDGACAVARAYAQVFTPSYGFDAQFAT